MAKKVKTAQKTATKDQLPDLVSGMTRLVERLEALERKTEQVLSRVGLLPNELRRAIQELSRPQAAHYSQPTPRPDQSFQQNQGPRERILYQAVCADCQKRCEVPFKPSGDRPVYCPECFAIRKAGHAPKDLTSHVVVPQHLKIIKPVSLAEMKPALAPKGKQAKPAMKTKKVASKGSVKKKK
ncbi:MAG: CxxC-x17-CxxC domain-containing protein [Candidatus Omnitrophota bacterium]